MSILLQLNDDVQPLPNVGVTTRPRPPAPTNQGHNAPPPPEQNQHMRPEQSQPGHRAQERNTRVAPNLSTTQQQPRNPSVISQPTPAHTSTPVDKQARQQQSAGSSKVAKKAHHSKKRTHMETMETETETEMNTTNRSPKKSRTSRHEKTTTHRDPLSPAQQAEEMEARLRRIRRKKGISATGTEEDPSPEAAKLREQALMDAMTKGNALDHKFLSPHKQFCPYCL